MTALENTIGFRNIITYIYKMEYFKKTVGYLNILFVF